MMPQPGYYTLVQYCPDASRLEAVNVGLVLFCPEMAYLDVKLADNDERICRVFGKEDFRPASLESAKQALAARLRSAAYRPRSLEEFQRFVDTRAGELILSPPRPIKVAQPPDQLVNLFRELVEQTPQTRRARATLAPQLEKVFQDLVLAGRAQPNYVAAIPVLGKRLRVPYAYRNGVLNLVKPKRFSPVESAATQAATQLAVEGDMIDRHGEDADGKKRLVIVASFGDNGDGQAVRRRVLDLLAEYPVKTVQPEDVPAFAEQVRREAHG